MKTFFLTLSVMMLAGMSSAEGWQHNYRQARRSNRGVSTGISAPATAAASAVAPTKVNSGFSQKIKPASGAPEHQQAIGRAPVSPIRALDEDTPAPRYLTAGALIRSEGMGYKTSEAAMVNINDMQGGTAITSDDSKAVFLNGAHKGVIVAPKDKVPPPNPGSGASGANAVTAGTPTTP